MHRLRVIGIVLQDDQSVRVRRYSRQHAKTLLVNWIKVVCLKELRSTIHSTPRYKDLSHMLDLPLEIILEVGRLLQLRNRCIEHFQILTWLHPIDLLNVCSSNKALRSLLAPDSSSTIWHTCFATYHDLPFPPAHFPPRRWAYLLFGPPTCWVGGYEVGSISSEHSDPQECGRPNTYPDFSLQRKICGKCMKHMYGLRVESSIFLLILHQPRSSPFDSQVPSNCSTSTPP